ncbi:MAG TPA: hypothetical protein VFY26_08885 [Anaerolineales bacterium]|nr:hypothetical protein [Anaerolineales bacterium]
MMKPRKRTTAIARAVAVATYQPALFFIAISGMDTISKTDAM